MQNNQSEVRDGLSKLSYLNTRLRNATRDNVKERLTRAVNKARVEVTGLLPVHEVSEDSPTTCPECGARTEAVTECTLGQVLVEQCLDQSCGYVFIVTEED